MSKHSRPSSLTVYRQIRDMYRLTQEEWARAFGVSRPTISVWESGTNQPPPAAQAAYRKLQDPIRTGDLHELERLRAEVIASAARAQKEARRLNRASPKGDLTKLLAVGVGAVAIGLLLAALFSED